MYKNANDEDRAGLRDAMCAPEAQGLCKWQSGRAEACEPGEAGGRCSQGRRGLQAQMVHRWLWVKDRYPKWNPGKWKHGLKPVVSWWFNFDPYPSC